MSKRIPFISENAPIIILVRPQLAENVGMVARAMMNCALSELRLVRPREDHLSEKAVAASSGAGEILSHAKCYDTLEEAVADVQLVLATTARPRDMTKPVYHPEKAVDLCKSSLGKGERVALLFGAERTGLENEEIISSDGIIEIPLNPKHSSLNLSQAVLLMGYAWFRISGDHDNTHLGTGRSQVAPKKEFELFWNYLEDSLDKKGYFRPANKKVRMRRNLKNIFARNQLTSAEIKTLCGAIGLLMKK